jgi:hypothetical protein
MFKINHNILRHFMGKKEFTKRNQNWVIKLHAYDFDIELYFKGKKNVIA